MEETNGVVIGFKSGADSVLEVDGLDWAGWVCAYTNQSGLALNAYVGRVKKQEGMKLLLEEAVEFCSITQIQGQATMRIYLGSPIEMCGLTDVLIQAVSIIDIEDAIIKNQAPITASDIEKNVAEERIRKAIFPFATARRQAEQKLKHSQEGAPMIAQAKEMPRGNGIVVPGRR